MDILYNKNISTNVVNDFIYNRCDLYSENYAVISIQYEGQKYSVMTSINKDIAYLGIWMIEFPQPIISEVCKTIFQNNPDIKKIKFEFSKTSFGYVKIGNHYRIELPSTVGELEHRLSKKGRYNIKREKDILCRTFGDYTIEEYTKENVPSYIIQRYFELKKMSHNKDYHLTSQQYLDEYHVSNIYVLKMGSIIGAILFSCEQFDIVYVENLTYDKIYAKYSCGQVLYDIFLCKLIEKGKKTVYLGGGHLEYKKRYGSIEEIVYHCIVYKHEWMNILMNRFRQIKLFVKSIIIK